MSMWTAAGMLIFGFVFAVPAIVFDVVLHRFVSRKSVRIAFAVSVPSIVIAWIMYSISGVVASEDPVPIPLIERIMFSLPLTAFVAVLSTLIALWLERAYRK